MLQHIQRLQGKDIVARRAMLKYILSEIEVEYKIQKFYWFGGLGAGENIIVDIDSTSSRQNKIFVSAHYDARGKSPGANDNGSGVAVILELIRALKKGECSHPLRFIF